MTLEARVLERLARRSEGGGGVSSAACTLPQLPIPLRKPTPSPANFASAASGEHHAAVMSAPCPPPQRPVPHAPQWRPRPPRHAAPTDSYYGDDDDNEFGSYASRLAARSSSSSEGGSDSDDYAPQERRRQ
eukprot:gnl/TRDRNA2_/TRDRNA2_85175_c0_seq2.p1 gnl/TRDRNA2_/TRDRNA2_85175_c0~~gnl/TRDRNA2_/TRDRNA2_85175_c0_seq2.p1  ORF type:complete len:131 (+),score=25.82 gnl/TRDRNA2_/TRDRNA2_85175_c0_seq2:59-451(+)